MSHKTRVAKLETKNGGNSRLWFIYVCLKSNEPKEQGLARTLNEYGIDQTMAGYVTYMRSIGDTFDERLNNYDGPVSSLENGDFMERLGVEIAKDPDVGPGPSRSRRKMTEASI